MAVPPRHLARQHRAHGAVEIADAAFQPHGLAAFDRRARRFDQVAVEHGEQIVVLLLDLVDRDAGLGDGLIEQPRQIDALGLPMRDRRNRVEPIGAAGHFAELAEAERRHDLAQLLGHEEEVVDHMLGLAGEALAQHRILRRHADRARIQMAFAHHDAAGRDQRRGGEAELVGAEQGADGDVAPVRMPPSTCTAIRPRNPFSTSVCCVSARPISQGLPAWVSEVSGEAPVPPS